MQFSVFVHKIINTKAQGVIVEAANGSEEGPPFIRFTLPNSQVKDCYISKRYVVTIEEA